MKSFLSFAGILVASALAAPAQTLPTVTSKTVNPQGKAATARKTADQRAAAYKGPKVVKSTKALGTEILRESKPAATPVAPTKQ